MEIGLDSWDPSFEQTQMRMKIFEMLPSLQYLDQTDIDGNDEEDDEGILNGKVLDDVSDGDDELEDEEGEEDEEDDEESEEEEDDVNNIRALYDNGVVLQDDDDDEDYNEDASDDEEEEDEGKPIQIQPKTNNFPSDPEPEQSTRGKKRKLDDRPV